MHPDPEQLNGFVSGTLDDETADRLADHVEQCEACEQTVRSLESASDTFIDSLRTPVAADPLRDEPECREMIDAIRAIGQDRSLASHQAAAAATDEPARHLGQQGQYKLLDKLGEGGMGAVYKALHTELDKIVALKVLSADRTQDEDAVGRFKREMRAVGKLDHPHIVRAMDAGEVDGEHFLVMEYVQGADLSQLVQQHGPLPIADACELIRQAAIGLDEAHDRGIVHRDIKPSNLILAQRRRKPPIVKILDMGLARLSEKEAADAKALTSDGQMMGTLDYMAPEQGQGAEGVDIRADIYGLGATLYKLLCGQAPFGDKRYDAPINKLMALATSEPPSIAERRDEVSTELAAVVHKMLAKDAADRYATPADVVAALTPFTAGADLAALAGVEVPAETRPIDDTSASMSASTPTDPTIDIVRESRPDVAAAGASLSTPPQPSARRPLTRPTYLIAAAAGAVGLILLGVLLTFRFGDVVVTVEAPDGKLPDDVKLLLNGDGDKIEITSDKRWKVDVSPGAYGVEIQGGNDQFAIEDDTLTVSRGGKNILVVRRKSASETAVDPGLTPPISRPPTDTIVDTARPADAQLLRRLADVDWKLGSFESDLYGYVAAPAEIPGIPADWQIRAKGGGNLSRTGKYMRFGDDPAYVVSARTGKVLNTLCTPGLESSHKMVWSPDDNYLAHSPDSGGTLDIQHRDGVSFHLAFKTGLYSLHKPSWSPDGSKIAIPGADGTLTKVKVFSHSGELLHVFNAPEFTREALWSPNGKYLAFNDDRTMPVIEAATGVVICDARRADGGRTEWTRWVPDENRLFSRYSGTVSLCDLHTGVTTVTDAKYWITAFSPDGRCFVTDCGEIRDSASKVLSRLDLSIVPGDRRFFWDEPNRIRVMSAHIPGSWAEYSMNGRVLAKSSPQPVHVPFHHVSWEKSEEMITAAYAGVRSHGVQGRQFRLSVDGTGDSTLEFEAVENDGRFMRCPAYNPADSGWLMARDDHYFQFDPQGKLIAGFPTNTSGGTQHSSFSPDGSAIALGYFKGGVELREKGKRVRSYRDLETFVSGLLWNAQGSQLCGWDGDGNICVWDVDEEQPIYTSSGLWIRPNAWHAAPRWSPDGNQLAWLSADSVHIVSVDRSDELILARDQISTPIIRWTSEGNGLLVDGAFCDLKGERLGMLKGAKDLREFTWTDSNGSAVAISGTDALIWGGIQEEPVRIRLPGESREAIRPADTGESGRPLSPSGRYWAAVSTRNVELVVDRGDVLLIDLLEKKLVWTGVGFSDGTMIRVADSGRIIAGPEDIDQYLTYLVRYPEGPAVPLTQLQFAARIGLSPEQQCLQQVVDLGGWLQLAGREKPLTATDSKDARDLPAHDEVIGISLAGSYFVNSDTLAHLPELSALAALDLSSSRIQDVDLGILLDLASLRTLNLAGTQVTNNVGTALPAGLEELDLSGTAVEDSLLSDLRSFKALRRLVLTDTKVTEEAVAAFRQAMPDCDVIR